MRCPWTPLDLILTPSAVAIASINLFLHGYQRFWIETEEYSFEEKLAQDLAVSTDSTGSRYANEFDLVFMYVHYNFERFNTKNWVYKFERN